MNGDEKFVSPKLDRSEAIPRVRVHSRSEDLCRRALETERPNAERLQNRRLVVVTSLLFDLVKGRFNHADVRCEDMIGRSPDDLGELLSKVIVKMFRRSFALGIQRAALHMVFVGEVLPDDPEFNVPPG